jgi:CIC family chloride channel protein
MSKSFLENGLSKFLVWRYKRINDKQFVAFLAILVGLAVGFSAVVIKNSVHLIQILLRETITEWDLNFLYLITPVVGITLAVLFIRFIIKQRVGHGIPSVLYAIAQEEGKIKKHNMFSSVVSSALTVGFGGSVGLEGPTVATGAAIGSNIGQAFRLNYKQITLLLGCACAGAMASIFKAPIAAIVFAIEVIMLDLTMASLIPLLMASVSAALTSYFFMGQDHLYKFTVTTTFSLNELPFYILLGILAGFVSVYFTRIYMFFGGIFDKIKNWSVRLIFGGILLGVLIFFFPALYGEGYEVINEALRGGYSYLFTDSIFQGLEENILVTLIIMAAVILLKVIATSITFGTGGIGGIFAPTLFMGANTGLFFASFMKQIGYNLNSSNFALVGMAGGIAGVLHAPLTAIFLIAEITGGYHLFMPLMIVSTISYATIKLFENNSVYTIQLAKRGQLMTHDKDKTVMKLLKVYDLIETNFSKVNMDDSLGDFVKVIAKSQRNVFPVVDNENNYKGIVFINDVREIIFQPEKYDNTFVRDLMFLPEEKVKPDDSMEDVAKLFHASGNYNLPVVSDDGKYIGFVSRANVFSAYRKMLQDFSED